MRWSYLSDKWDSRTKHRDLKMGLVTKKTITRSIPGKWRNCMASTTIKSGINIWKVLLKKSDPNRKGFSFMIGVIDASTKMTELKDRVFSEVGGYGFVTTNGSLYHRGRRGMKYYDTQKKGNRPFRNGDTLSVVVDYYRGTLSFWVNQIDCGPAWSNIDRSTHFRLCIALRGCDEIKLMDQEQDQRKADERYKQITAQRLAAKQKVPRTLSINRKAKGSVSDELKLDLIALPEEEMAQLQRKTTPNGSVLNELRDYKDSNHLMTEDKEDRPKLTKRISSGTLFAKFRRTNSATLGPPNHQKSRSFNWRKRKQSQSDQVDDDKSHEIDFDVSQSELVEHEYSPVFAEPNTPNGGGNVLL